MFFLYYLDSTDFPLTQCQCNGTVLLNHKTDYPDYESCREKCKETNGCRYFGVWNSTKWPDLCKGWGSCDECEPAWNYNQVYEIDSGKNAFGLFKQIFSLSNIISDCLSHM